MEFHLKFVLGLFAIVIMIGTVLYYPPPPHPSPTALSASPPHLSLRSFPSLAVVPVVRIVVEGDVVGGEVLHIWASIQAIRMITQADEKETHPHPQN